MNPTTPIGEVKLVAFVLVTMFYSCKNNQTEKAATIDSALYKEVEALHKMIIYEAYGHNHTVAKVMMIGKMDTAYVFSINRQWDSLCHYEQIFYDLHKNH